VPGGRVQIEAAALRGRVCVGVRPLARADPTAPLAADACDSLEMARQLVGLSDGSLEVEAGAQASPFVARLFLPLAEQVAVLVIDDNVDTLRLFQRYLAGSRYPFIGARDAAQALALAEELTPRIIVLDVMMPGVDGWELLGRLRVHPKIGQVPIIVCTILPEEQLALALGATAFLRKPVSREAFLTALDRLAGPPRPGGH